MVTNTSLASNESVNITLVLEGASKFRDAPLGIKVDSQSRVVELNENNNLRWLNEKYIEAPQLDLTQLKELSDSWSLLNEALINAPLFETYDRTTDTGNFEQLHGVFFIDRNGVLKSINGKDGSLIWSKELSLNQSNNGLNDKMVIATQGTQKYLFVTDSKQNKIIQLSLTGDIINHFDLGNGSKNPSDMISFFYEDNMLKIFTENGILTPKTNNWRDFEDVDGTFKGNIDSFYSNEYGQRLILANGILYKTNGQALRKDNSELVYKSSDGELNANLFAIADFDNDGELDIASKTCDVC